MFTTHRTQRSRRAAVGLASAAAAFALALTGCSPAADEAPTSNSASQGHEAAVTATDTWVKATAADAKPGEAMSGVFGVIENHGDEDLTITGLTSDVAGVTELHEVVDGKMRKIEGDVTVPAGGSLLLEPGANHIMLMDITEPLAPGDDVTVTLTFSDGTTLDIVALVKDTSGANESYDDIDHGDMDMSGDTGSTDHG
ncbi:copper chaperone PCu(A)C [Leucobacter aridicollis]|uniref:Copper chaperone PCu(A)C n=1 Tax=Leucobacter aridicollis TaxID=283878 RepID=A0A852R3J9_9MICO|nr:copper chaperone PCu(A)C [Leucobacter aridicollis]MBL3681696.1 copper chaperone PCu(A)C [Leucobacter aridicollis]NYD27267.1 hypothetical protein [Leucobacter aridicollis]